MAQDFTEDTDKSLVIPKWILEREALMFLQGDLQAVFDALFIIGAIDPVLKLDWEQVTNEMAQNPQIVKQAMETINSCRGNKDLLVESLYRMDTRVVNFIAMEVAREFVEFQDRSSLH